jgi:micrococcal nuclease
MSGGWDEEWELAQARRPRPARRLGFGALVLTVLALGTLMVGVTRWRHWGATLAPQPARGVVAADLMAGATDHEAAHFTLCKGPDRITCVVDGDTIWYQGSKIRLTDINAPEVSEPQCDDELALGEKATRRLVALLNAGPFSLVADAGRDTDKYGRKLRSIRRGGKSLGAVLVSEGLAERWTGHRRDWCH